jgi:hypothetical protein
MLTHSLYCNKVDLQQRGLFLIREREERRTPWLVWGALLVLLILLPLPCLALDPAWSAAGSGTVALSADGGYLLYGGESFGLYDASGKALWR